MYWCRRESIRKLSTRKALANPTRASRAIARKRVRPTGEWRSGSWIRGFSSIAPRSRKSKLANKARQFKNTARNSSGAICRALQAHSQEWRCDGEVCARSAVEKGKRADRLLCPGGAGEVPCRLDVHAVGGLEPQT